MLHAPCERTGRVELVVAERIPFPFTLIDARHRPFVDGRRDTLLTLSQVVRSGNTVAFVTLWLMGLLCLFFGGRSLVYDLSVTWKTADAAVTNMTLLPTPPENSYKYWYFYEFKTEAGEIVQDHIVDDSAEAHAVGDVVRVYYVEHDPKDNYYADDPLPRGVRDWFFIGLGAFMLGGGVYCMRSALGNYRALRRLAHSGQPLPGEIINSQSLMVDEALKVKIDYLAKTADGSPFAAGDVTMAIAHLAEPALPSVGTKVAIWYAEKEGAVLL
jgi:hypothetical protein